jgi:hypothetical protein
VERPLEELQRMGHNIKRLWRAYKRNHPNAALLRHDRTIKRLDKHEDIRYPDPALGSIGVSMEWSGEPGAVTTYGGMKLPKQYAVVVVVSDIDDLVAEIIRTSSWNPPQSWGPMLPPSKLSDATTNMRIFSRMAKSPECRFPPPWTVEEQPACFVVRDHNGQQLAYILL